MRHLFLTLCPTILSCYLMAEEKPLEYSLPEHYSISAACQSYEATKGFFEKTDPEAVVQLDLMTGVITVVPGEKGFVALSKESNMLNGTAIVNPLSAIVVSDTASHNVGNVIFSGGATISCSGTLTVLKSDPTYAKNLPIRHFILTEQQMSQFFSHFPPEPEPLNFYGLSESNLYLIIQIKNTGPRHAYGTLHFPFFPRFFSICIDVEANTNEFSTYVVPLGNRESEDFEDAEDVDDRLNNLEWDKISVGPTEDELLDLLEQWNEGPKSDQHEEEIDSKEDEDSEEETTRFPIFRSSE